MSRALMVRWIPVVWLGVALAGVAAFPGCARTESYSCSSANCPRGCCTPNGVCMPGVTDAACGAAGGLCAPCAASGLICHERRCFFPCVPQCAGTQCGPDGCGGSCGSCPAGATCTTARACCVADCAGRCGGASDGCASTCSGPCASGQTCVGLACVDAKTVPQRVVFAPPHAPIALAVDARGLYWLDWRAGEGVGLFALPTGSTSEVVLAAPGASSVPRRGPGWQGIALDAVNIYWLDYAAGNVMSVPRRGGAPVVLASGEGPLGAIVVDSGNVYWSVGDFTTTPPGAIRTVPAGGGTPSTLALTINGFVDRLAVDSTGLYWTDNRADGAVLKLPKGAPAPLILTGQLSLPTGIAVNATDVYWVNVGLGDADGSLMRIPLGGGAPEVLAAGLRRPVAVALDAAFVYWGSAGNGREDPGSVMRMPLASGRPSTVSSSGTGASALALDDASLFWLSGADGPNAGILKLGK